MVSTSRKGNEKKKKMLYPIIISAGILYTYTLGSLYISSVTIQRRDREGR